MKMKWRKREYLIAALVTAVYAAAIMGCFGAFYLTNDDILIRDTFSGRYSGVPDARVCFVTYPLGWLMVQLYTLAPQVDWWALFLLAVPLLGLFLVQVRVLQRLPDHPVLAVFLVAAGFASCGAYAIAQFTFTFSGALAGAAAVFLFITGKHTGNPVKEYFFSFVLLLFAFCFRMHTFLMVMPFIGIYAILIVLRSEAREAKRLFRRFALLAGALGAVCLLMWGSHRLVYSTAQWQAFMEFQDLRSGIHDFLGYPNYEENQGFYQDVGISEAELNCLTTSRAGGTNTVLDYSVDIMDILEAVYTQGTYARENRSLREKILDPARLIRDRLTLNTATVTSGMLLLLFYAECSFLLLQRKRYADILFLLAGAVLFWAELIYLGIWGRITRAIIYSELWLLGISLGASLLALHGTVPKDTRQYRSAFPYLLLIYGAVVWIGFTAQTTQQLEDRAQSTYQLRNYCAQRTENVYFQPNQSIAGNHYQFGKEDFDTSFNNLQCLGGWNAYTPAYRQSLETFGLEDGLSIEESILHQENVYVISEEQHIAELLNYFSWKYGDAVSWEIVDTIDAFSGVSVYDFSLSGS